MYLAQNLKYLRKRNNESQNDIAKLLFVSQRCISQYENNEIRPDIEKIIFLSKHYNVTLDELILKDLRPSESIYIINIRFLRKKHEMTQKGMAALLGYRGKQGYNAIETGKTKPSVEDLEKLADFFGVTLDQLVKQDLSKEMKANGET